MTESAARSHCKQRHNSYSTTANDKLTTAFSWYRCIWRAVDQRL